MQIAPVPSGFAASAHALPAPAVATAAGWLGGVVRFSGRGPETMAFVTLERIVGRQGGYDTVRGATIAAAHLTRGEALGSVAVCRDGDGRIRLYEASLESRTGAALGPLAFEFGVPRGPSGATMDRWLFQPAEGLLELRDGTVKILPNPYGPGE
ncbi:MAG: hypothetical protein JWO69_1520 [Thermoleophilia bacterium]|nr:hypothetical protein [Thermoleophilia bacterium]